MSAVTPDLESELDRTMLADRHRLRKLLRSIRQAELEKKPFDRNLVRLREEIEKSARLRQQRLDRKPSTIAYDDELPI